MKKNLFIILSPCLMFFGQSIDRSDLNQRKLDWIANHGLQIPDGSVRSIGGSTLALDSMAVEADGSLTFELHGTCVSADSEFWDQLTLTFPMGFLINSMLVADFEAGSLAHPPTLSGVGTNVAKYTESSTFYPCSSFGFLISDDSTNEAIFTVNVTPSGIGTFNLAYMIEGDHWMGGTESVICSTSSSCSYNACYDAGTLPIGATDIGFEVLARVPTMDEWTTILFAFLIGSLGIFFLKRK